MPHPKPGRRREAAGRLSPPGPGGCRRGRPASRAGGAVRDWLHSGTCDITRIRRFRRYWAIDAHAPCSGLGASVPCRSGSPGQGNLAGRRGGQRYVPHGSSHVLGAGGSKAARPVDRVARRWAAASAVVLLGGGTLAAGRGACRGGGADRGRGARPRGGPGADDGPGRAGGGPSQPGVRPAGQRPRVGQEQHLGDSGRQRDRPATVSWSRSACGSRKAATTAR